MPALDRRISTRGPKFWEQGDDVMFVNFIDASTRDGPRLATDDDIAMYPDEYRRAFDAPSYDPPGVPLVQIRDPEETPANRRGRPPKAD